MSNFNRHKKIYILLGLMLVGLIAVPSINQQAKSNPSPINSVAKVLPTTTTQPTVDLSLTKQEWQGQRNDFEKSAKSVTVSDLYKAPSTYEDKDVYFTCKVSRIIPNTRSSINCDDPNEIGSWVQIDVGMQTFTDTTKIHTNDLVKIDGLVKGAMTGNNAFGQQVNGTGITELFLEDLTTGYVNN